MKQRLDQYLVSAGLVASRSQAESYIKLSLVQVAGKIITKSGFLVTKTSQVEVLADEQFVSRAALKLKSVSSALRIDFNKKIVLDVGSSTGGFTQYALTRGAERVIAVEVGTNQLDPRLRGDPRIDLYEKTDIRSMYGPQHRLDQPLPSDAVGILDEPDIVLADVSFMSLRDILPAIARLSTDLTRIIVMVKPQFEASQSSLKHKGVIKNDSMRRDILKDFEIWTNKSFMIIGKADSSVAGSKGNLERFYELRKLAGRRKPELS